MRARLALPPGWQGKIWRYSSQASLIESHQHAELELNFVTAGEVDYLAGDGLLRLAAGSLLWLFPGHEHVLTRRSSDVSMWIAVFRRDLVRAARGTEELRALWHQKTPARLVQVAGPDYVALDGLSAATTRFRGSVPGRNHGLAFLLEVAWLATRQRETLPTDVGVHPAVARAAAWMRNATFLPDLTETAQRAGLSPSQLSRRFHADLGVTFRDFQKRLRVERAMALLAKHPSLSLTEAAFESGFGSYPQFHRAFRQVTGLGPRAWLRRAEAVPLPPIITSPP